MPMGEPNFRFSPSPYDPVLYPIAADGQRSVSFGNRRIEGTIRFQSDFIASVAGIVLAVGSHRSAEGLTTLQGES